MSKHISKAVADGGRPEGIIKDPDNLDVKSSTRLLMIDIHRKLEDQYPGFHWGIQGDDQGGIINIFCLDLHANWGTTIKIVDIQDDPTRRLAINYAGELLDRFKWTHRRFGKRAYDRNFWESLPKDAYGQCTVVDLGDTRKQVSARKKIHAEIRAAVAEGKAEFHELKDGTTVVSIED